MPNADVVISSNMTYMETLNSFVNMHKTQLIRDKQISAKHQHQSLD